MAMFSSEGAGPAPPPAPPELELAAAGVGGSNGEEKSVPINSVV